MQVTDTVVVVEMDIEKAFAGLSDDFSGILTANLHMAYVK